MVSTRLETSRPWHSSDPTSSLLQLVSPPVTMLTSGFLWIVLAFASIASSSAKNLVLTNDDGWADAMIRAQYDELTDAGFNVILHCQLACACYLCRMPGCSIMSRRKHVWNWVNDCNPDDTHRAL